MNRELLLSIIENIKSIRGHYPGKKELQKTIYLMQKKGLDLDYSYRFYFYGPYSDALDEDIQRLTIQGALEVQQDDLTHRITIPSRVEANPKIGGKTAKCIRETTEELKHIDTKHLELMTTIVFLLDNHIIKDRASEADIIAKVHEVKGNKYNHDEILRHYELLLSKGYIQ